MRILVVLIKGRPEKGSYDAAALDSAEWEVQSPNHVLVRLMIKGEVSGREGLGVLCILLETDSARVNSCSSISIPLNPEQTHINRTPLTSSTPGRSLGGAKAP